MKWAIVHAVLDPAYAPPSVPMKRRYSSSEAMVNGRTHHLAHAGSFDRSAHGPTGSTRSSNPPRAHPGSRSPLNQTYDPA